MQKMDGGAARLNSGVARPRGVGIPALKSRLDEPAQAQWKSGGGNVLYKDQILPPAHKRITREQLDKQLIADAPRQDSLSLRKISHGDGKDGLTTLARCCLRIIADNIEQKKIQDALGTRIMNHRHIKNLCKRVRKRFHGRELPFSVWEALLAIDADAVPSEMKAYTGLVFDDSDELSTLNSVHNTTLLDLSNTAFQALDIYKVRIYFSNSLVALRMDHLASMDDDAITVLSRNVGQEDGKAFARLEVLTLRGCKLVTDRSAPKLARFTALKMLGELG